MGYSDNLAMITVLVTHLGSCKLKSKSASKLAEDLSLPKDKVEYVLTNFPELFIHAGKAAEGTDYEGEKTFTLQLRYALRWQSKDDSGNTTTVPIEAEHQSALLTFIDNRVANELSAKRQKMINLIAVSSAIVSALAAIYAATIK